MAEDDVEIVKPDETFKINLPIANRSKFLTCVTKGNKSHNDVDFKVIKSAIQKYIRRGMYENALYQVCQAYLIYQK
jgi:hypothetical protein